MIFDIFSFNFIKNKIGGKKLLTRKIPLFYFRLQTNTLWRFISTFCDIFIIFVFLHFSTFSRYSTASYEMKSRPRETIFLLSLTIPRDWHFLFNSVPRPPDFWILRLEVSLEINSINGSLVRTTRVIRFVSKIPVVFETGVLHQKRVDLRSFVKMDTGREHRERLSCSRFEHRRRHTRVQCHTNYTLCSVHNSPTLGKFLLF